VRARVCARVCVCVCGRARTRVPNHACIEFFNIQGGGVYNYLFNVYAIF